MELLLIDMSDFPDSLRESKVDVDSDPLVIDLNDAHADDFFEALASSTARQLFQRLQGSPTHPSELAAEIDTSVQNVHYHLGRLETAGVIEVVDTVYSTKGREMNVYAPTADPLVFVSEGTTDRTNLADSLSRFLGVIGILTFTSVTVQVVVEKLLYSGGPTPVETSGQYALPPMTNVAPPVGVYVLLAGLTFLICFSLIMRLRDSTSN